LAKKRKGEKELRLYFSSSIWEKKVNHNEEWTKRAGKRVERPEGGEWSY